MLDFAGDVVWLLEVVDAVPERLSLAPLRDSVDTVRVLLDSGPYAPLLDLVGDVVWLLEVVDAVPERLSLALLRDSVDTMRVLLGLGP